MITRRKMLAASASAMALAPFLVGATAESPALITRPIPSSSEQLPVIGMGTSRTFDAGADAATVARLTEVMGLFFAGGGTVIDSSPMYGEAESRVGDVLRNMEQSPPLFAATTVWTEGKDAGIAQMQESARRMNVERFDLIAVHNLVDWKTQLATLKAWKQEGKVRYIGITTSHGRRHDDWKSEYQQIENTGYGSEYPDGYDAGYESEYQHDYPLEDSTHESLPEEDSR